MQIEDFKRWHWAVIGLAVGLLFGLVFRLAGVEHNPEVPQARNAPGLLSLAVMPDFKTGRPIVDDLVIHPLSSEDARAQLVTFRMRQVYRLGDGTTITQWEPRKVWTEVPHNAQHATFGDYVTSLKNKGLLEGAPIQFAWWQQPMWGVLLYTLLGLLVIGGIWPAVLSALIGAGFGTKKEAKNDYDLDRFDHTPEEELSGKKAMTVGDADQLAAATAELEESTEGMTGEMQTPGAAPEGEAGDAEEKEYVLAQEEVRTVDQDGDDEDKEYDGAYYPVAKSSKKKD